MKKPKWLVWWGQLKHWWLMNVPSLHSCDCCGKWLTIYEHREGYGMCNECYWDFNS